NAREARPARSVVAAPALLSADALIAHFEQQKSRALGNARRRDAGLYYTPAHLAARVVEIALREGGIATGRVLDPCAGAGAFLVAAARAGLRDLHGFDLDPEALLAQAEVAAIGDLGKPFASAKDTRVQAVVLVRRPALVRPAYVGRGAAELSPVSREELAAAARRGWFVYRSAEERALCTAMESISVPLGSACLVGYGMRTGANARHVGRRDPGPGESGLVGGEDVVPYALRWRPKTLLDPEPLLALVRRQLGTARVAVQRIRTNAQV